MYRFIKLLALVILILILFNSSVLANPNITAKAAILIDFKSGRVLYKKNENEKLPMASTTKIMTAIVALEKGNLEDIVTVSKKAVSIGGSKVPLNYNEKIKLKNLLYCLLMKSGNDAALAIAEHIGGNVNNFVLMMNDKAEEIGALNTHFRNPHGLDNNIYDHYTTAYDLALITKYALNNAIFSNIVSTKQITIESESQKSRNINNTNKLLWLYNGADGVKTGYTGKAGRCLVSSATRGNQKYIAVVLNSRNIWKDSMALLDYAFNNYKVETILKGNEKIKTLNVSNGNRDKVVLLTKKDVSVPLRQDEKNMLSFEYEIPENIKAPVGKYEPIGKLKIKLKDDIIAETDLISGDAVEENSFDSNFFKVIHNWINDFYYR